MYKNFVITESEREEILNRHKESGYGRSFKKDNEVNTLQNGVENIVNQLSDDQVIELQQQLNSLGITPSTSVKDAMSAIRNGGNMESDMNEDMDEDMKKEKVANILSTIGTGLIGSTFVPLIPIALGNAMNIGFSGGLAVHLASAGILIALAKALGKKEGSTEHGNY